MKNYVNSEALNYETAGFDLLYGAFEEKEVERLGDRTPGELISGVCIYPLDIQ